MGSFQVHNRCIYKWIKDKNVDVIVGPEARGFLMGTPVAMD